MPRFEKIEELIGELYRNRKLLSTLFDKRMTDINEEVVLPFLNDDREKLEDLVDYNLLYSNKSQVRIEGRLLEFFEEFLEVDETVHVLYILENLDQIREYRSYYQKDHSKKRKAEYLLRIKKNLRKITRLTLKNVKTLRRNTDDTYKSESNFEIKREKLDNIRSQRDSLEDVMKDVGQLLDDDLFFRTVADDEMMLLIHQLRITLNDSFHNLIEIQQQIIEYLNHIEKRVYVVEKVFRLKALRDKHHLKERSNFHAVAEKINDLPLKKQEPLRWRLPIREVVEKEEMHTLIFKVRKQLKNRKSFQQNVAGEIAAEALTKQESAENVVNMAALKKSFLKKDEDLFNFIMNHDFQSEVKDIERIRLYCRLASLYESEFKFSEETAFFQDVEYALVYPGNKKQISKL